MSCSDPELYTQLTITQEQVDNISDDLHRLGIALGRWEANSDVVSVLSAIEQAREMLVHICVEAECAKDAL